MPPFSHCSLEEDEERERGITPMYVKYDARLYGPRKPGQKVGFGSSALSLLSAGVWLRRLHARPSQARPEGGAGGTASPGSCDTPGDAPAAHWPPANHTPCVVTFQSHRVQ